VPLLKAGKLRALAVSSEARHLEFPDVPTVRESGFPNYVNYAWTSFYVRAQTPDDITARLSEAVMKVHAATDAKEYTRKTGGELMPLDAAQMARFQREEIERFRGIAEKAGIRPE
jgi:tripartite-type tricarboxylate transporter receptor subunit TctC